MPASFTRLVRQTACIIMACCIIAISGCASSPKEDPFADVFEVRSVLDIEAGPHGRSKLHRAVQTDDPALIVALIGQGARVNAPDVEGWTPLMLAVSEHRAGIAALLLEHGADPSITSIDGQAPLHKAASSDDEEITLMLVDAGVDVNAKVSMRSPFNAGDTSLHLALAEGHGGLAMRLLGLGADPVARNSLGRTPMHLAAYGGLGDVAHALINAGAGIDARDVKGDSPLHMAMAGGQAPMALELIERGADIHAPYTGVLPMPGAPGAYTYAEHWPPILIAARYDQHGVARVLLERGVEPDVRDAEGDTALHVAARFGSAHVARLLVDAGADVLARNAEGLSPLDIAGAEGHRAVWRILDEAR